MTNSKLLYCILFSYYGTPSPVTRIGRQDPMIPQELGGLGHGRRCACTITSTSCENDDETSNRSVNESNECPEGLATVASGRTTTTGGVERFASAAMKNTVWRSNAHEERVKWLKMDMRPTSKSFQAVNQLVHCCAVLGITSPMVVQGVEIGWWSTQGLVKCMMYLMEAERHHSRALID